MEGTTLPTANIGVNYTEELATITTFLKKYVRPRRPVGRHLPQDDDAEAEEEGESDEEDEEELLEEIEDLEVDGEDGQTRRPKGKYMKIFVSERL